MHRLFLLSKTLIIFFVSTVSAQETTLKASVIDNSQLPIDIGNIVALHPKDSAIITGDVFFDGSAKLLIQNHTNILLQVSALGYEPYYASVILKDGLLELDPIILTINSLQEITITADQKLFERNGPNLVVNVANTPLSNAGTVMDLMQSAPKVNIGRNGQISVFGKGNALVYIDGQQVASAQVLNTLSSTEIASIEIIENPSAQYDASGNAVISITTKSKNLEGYKVGLTQEVGYGKHFRSFFQATGYLKVKGLMVQADYGLRPQTIGNQFRQDRTFLGDADQYYTNNHYLLQNEWLGHNYSVRGSYTLGSHSTIGVNYTGTDGDADKIGNNFRFSTVNNNPSSFDITTLVTGDTRQGSNTITGYYHYKGKDNKSSLQINGQYSDYSFDRNERSNQNVNADEVLQVITRGSKNVNKIDIYTFQADYSNQLSDKLKLLTGIKSATISNSSFVNFEDILENGEINRLDEFSNRFDYNENILAAYSQLNWSGSSSSINFGLRGEWTRTEGVTEDNEQNDNLNRKYFNLFPSISYSKTINDNLSGTISYNYRINRPLFQDLNPYVLYVDSLVSLRGNSRLVPEYGHNFSANVGYKKWSFGIGYTRINNKVNQIFRSLNEENPNIISFVKENLLFTELYSFNISRPINYKKYSANFIAGGFWDNHQVNDTNDTFANKQAGYFIQFNQFLKLPWSMQLAAYAKYTSPRVDGVYNDNSISFINISLSKSFLKDQLTVRLWANDILDKFKFTGTAQFNNMRGTYLSEGDWHFVKLVLNWNFGKLGTSNFNRNKISDKELNRINRGQ